LPGIATQLIRLARRRTNAMATDHYDEFQFGMTASIFDNLRAFDRLRGKTGRSSQGKIECKPETSQQRQAGHWPLSVLIVEYTRISEAFIVVPGTPT